MHYEGIAGCGEITISVHGNISVVYYRQSTGGRNDPYFPTIAFDVHCRHLRHSAFNVLAERISLACERGEGEWL